MGILLIFPRQWVAGHPNAQPAGVRAARPRTPTADEIATSHAQPLTHREQAPLTVRIQAADIPPARTAGHARHGRSHRSYLPSPNSRQKRRLSTFFARKPRKRINHLTPFARKAPQNANRPRSSRRAHATGVRQRTPVSISVRQRLPTSIQHLSVHSKLRAIRGRFRRGRNVSP